MFTENNKGRGVLVRIFLIPPVFYGIPLIPLFPIIGNLEHSKGLLGDVLGSVARGRSHRLTGDDAAGPSRTRSRSSHETRGRENDDIGRPARARPPAPLDISDIHLTLHQHTPSPPGHRGGDQ